MWPFGKRKRTQERQEHLALLSEAKEVLARFPPPTGEGGSWTVEELWTHAKVSIEFISFVHQALLDLSLCVEDPALLRHAEQLEQLQDQLSFMREYLREPRSESMTTFFRARIYGDVFRELSNVLEAHGKYPERVRALAPGAAARLGTAHYSLRWFPDEESLVAARQLLDGDEFIVHRLIPRAEALSILEKAESLASKQDLGTE
jgi:hypothetical protein